MISLIILCFSQEIQYDIVRSSYTASHFLFTKRSLPVGPLTEACFFRLTGLPLCTPRFYPMWFISMTPVGVRVSPSLADENKKAIKVQERGQDRFGMLTISHSHQFYFVTWLNGNEADLGTVKPQACHGLKNLFYFKEFFKTDFIFVISALKLAKSTRKQ